MPTSSRSHGGCASTRGSPRRSRPSTARIPINTLLSWRTTSRKPRRCSGRTRSSNTRWSPGESALAASAHEQALAHFERALAAKDRGDDDDQTGALYFGRGRAQLAVLPRYELEPASSSLRRAFDYYEQVGDIGRAVSVAACQIPLSLGLGDTAFPELITRASEASPP